MGAFMLCYGSVQYCDWTVGASYTPDLQGSRSQYACALVFCQIRGGDSNFVRLSFSGEASLWCRLRFLRSAPVDYVVIMLSTVETLDTVHLRLVSLAIVDAVVVLCKQVIVFGLCEREQIKDVDGMTENYDFKDARRYLRQSLGHHSRSHRRRRRHHRNHRQTWLVGREGEGRGRVLYREMHRSQSRSLKSQNHTW